jgi:pimeloyl-ACP methyl ester carboxylesterase
MQRASLTTTYVVLTLVSTAFAQVDSPAGAPQMKQAPVTGGEIKYEIRGDGEPVLLIHGAFVAASFLPLMDEPSMADYRLIRYHRAGYAGSTAPAGPVERQVADAVALLRYLGVERAHIVGHSAGAIVALQVAVRAPGVVHSLVLLEPPMGTGPSRRKWIQDVIEPSRERYRAGDPVGAVEIFMRGVGGPDWRRTIARTVPGGPKQAEQDAATFFSFDVGVSGFDEEKAKKIDPSTPILYMWGTDTPSFFKEDRDAVRAWFPHAEDQFVRAVGHSLQMEDPRALAEGISGFLRRHPLKRLNQ